MSKPPNDFDFDAAMERTWADVLQQYRDEGLDPEDVINRAADNLAGWRGIGSTEPPDGEL